MGSFWPYATTVFDYIRRSMPYQRPQSLSDEQVYALTAYLLFLNGIIGENDVMDARALPAVQMPNRDHFILAYPLPEDDRGWLLRSRPRPFAVSGVAPSGSAVERGGQPGGDFGP